MKTILDIIGAPAALEQCAEECSELAQACLKLARKLRGENPTPVEESFLYASLEEEIADVELCIDIVTKYLAADYKNNVVDIILYISEIKKNRWRRRLEEK